MYPMLSEILASLNPFRRHRRVAGLIALVVTMAGGALADSPVYLGLMSQCGIYRLDPATGNREFFDYETYPDRIGGHSFEAQRDGSLMIGTIGATQMFTLGRLTLSPLAYSVVSGGTNGGTTEQRGAGPVFHGRTQTVFRLGDKLISYQLAQGIFETDIATGDRRILAALDVFPTSTTLTLAGGMRGGAETTPDVPLYGILDVAALSADIVLVADRYEGLVRVWRDTGKRARLLAEPSAYPTAQRIDVLPNGLIVFGVVDPDVRAIWSVNPSTGETKLYSGSWGGLTRGEGPEFSIMYDLAVDFEGRLWLYDALDARLFRIEANGDRVVVASNAAGGGTGELLPDYMDRPFLGTYERKPAAGAANTSAFVVY